MQQMVRIGTRESQLAVWQAKEVQQLLHQNNIQSELVYIKSEGDVDTVTPLYALGVQGVFTRSLDAALLSKRIDIAVHSMKDVPVQLAAGIQQAAVLPRASVNDILVYNGSRSQIEQHLALAHEHPDVSVTIGTSSIRRIAQWKHRYPGSVIQNLRGNVNTRLRKLEESTWHGAIFAAAGLERIKVRPENSLDLDWMLPAPAQGAIMVVCREADDFCYNACAPLNDPATAICVAAERQFLSALLGGCSTPISALAQVEGERLLFKGNVTSPDGARSFNIQRTFAVTEPGAGQAAAKEILENDEVRQLVNHIRNAKA